MIRMNQASTESLEWAMGKLIYSHIIIPSTGTHVCGKVRFTQNEYENSLQPWFRKKTIVTSLAIQSSVPRASRGYERFLLS